MELLMPNLINKETGYKIATIPEELPPLRDGYIRLIHQTHSAHAESLAEKGLIYNREYAGMGKNPYDKNYMDAGYMSVPYREEEFWNRLTDEGVRHMNSDVIAIFDIPAEEAGAHFNPYLACHLNGTISRGYMVGVIPNYGTKDSLTEQRLTVPEMEEKKRIAKSNPLPPLYETPNWRENVAKAQETFTKEQDDIEIFPHYQHNNDDNNEANTPANYASNSNNQGMSDFSDWGEINCENPPIATEHTNKPMNEDHLQIRLQNIKQRLAENNLEESFGKTGNSNTGKVSKTDKEVAEIQTQATKEIAFKRVNQIPIDR